MKIKDLIKYFNNKSMEIYQIRDSTSRFRAASYKRIANKIEAVYSSTEKATIEKINKLDISDYMKTKAIEIINGKNKIQKELKQKTKTTNDKTKTTNDKTTNDKTKTTNDKTKTTNDKTKTTNDKTTKRQTTNDKTKTTNDKTTSDKTKLINELSQLIGIGPEKAKKIIAEGLTDIKQLNNKKYKEMLPEETKLFISLKPLREIPNEDIKALEPYIINPSKKIGKTYIVGSYRRKKPTSRDIDVMLVSSKDGALDKYLESIKKELPNAIFPYAKGKDKLSFIIDTSKANIINTKNNVYKVDVFRTLPEDEISMLLYSTGSKEHNILMRQKAKKLGYLLNQKGLFKDNEKIKNLNSEEDYFNILGMTYKTPKDRI
jgi:DNA polymerase/3'-5' exonuclease PolX